MTSNIPLSDASASTQIEKSGALTERSDFQPQKAQHNLHQAPSHDTSAHGERSPQQTPWWRQWSTVFTATICTITVSNAMQNGATGDVVNAGLLVGTGWLFMTRFRRFGFRIWLPVISAFLGFNIYAFFMSAVLHWGEAAYHLMLFFGSVTALLFYIVMTLVLPGPKQVVLPALPSRTELAIALAKEEQARLLQQDKTDDPEFMAWQSVLERYQQILEREQGGTSA